MLNTNNGRDTIMSNQKAQASQKKSKMTYRWDMVFAGSMLMLCFGTVYAWSYFQVPLMQTFGWNNAQVSLVFSLAQTQAHEKLP